MCQVLKVEQSQSSLLNALKNSLIVKKVGKCLSENFELNVEVRVIVELIVLGHAYPHINSQIFSILMMSFHLIGCKPGHWDRFYVSG